MSKEKKVILYVVGSLDIGGTERHLIQVLPRIHSEKWDVILYCLRNKGAWAPKLEVCGIKVISPPLESSGNLRLLVWRMFRLCLSSIKLIYIIVLLKPHILHLFLPISYVIGSIAAIITGIKYRIMSRRSLNHYQKKRPKLIPFEHWLHKKMHVILANSKAIIKQLHLEENVPLTKLAIIHNGIDVSAMSSEIPRVLVRKALNISNESVVLITIANLIPYKGHSDLLCALGKIKNKLKISWHLLCIGRDDGMRNNLVRLSTDLDIHRNVQFLGSRNDIADLLNAADIGVLASHQEGFSNFILEAMSVGLPIIATDVGGNTEAVIDNETGIVVPPKNSEKLGNAILRLVSNPIEAREMGKKGEIRVQTHFSLDKCVSQYEKLYSGLIEGYQPSEIFSQVRI